MAPEPRHVAWDDIDDGTKVPRPEGYVHPWPTDLPYRSRVYDDAAGVEHVSFVVNRMPPGTSGQHHRHVAAEEIFYVMSGSCQLQIDDETIDLRPHDAVRVAAEAFRSMYNPGHDECCVLVAGAPLAEFTESGLEAFFAVNK